MAERRLPVRIEVSDDFTGRMALAAEAARRTHADWALSEATWEPHDWSTL